MRRPWSWGPSRSWSLVSGGLLDEADGGGRGERLAAEFAGDLKVLLDFLALAQVAGTGELLGVDHVGQLLLGEAQYRERPALGRVDATGEWDDLNGHALQGGKFDEVTELGAHHRRAGRRAAHPPLVHPRPAPGRVGRGQQILALEAQRAPPFCVVGERGPA